MTANATDLAAADALCDRLVRHYENFTVASRLSPARLRRDLTRVYAFCRTTDDLGDESGVPSQADPALRRWREDTESMFAGGTPAHPVLVALQATVSAHVLPAQPFLDLIDANLMDQRVSSYEAWPDLLGYCRLSAAPVGRMVLGLMGRLDARTAALSDDVCIGLQLANFAQDVSVDARKGRTYLLQSDLRSLGDRGAVRAMCERGLTLLGSGRELERMFRGRLRLQLALYRLGGEEIIAAVSRSGYATHTQRPSVGPVGRLRILQRLLSQSHRHIAPAEAPPVLERAPSDG